MLTGYDKGAKAPNASQNLKRATSTAAFRTFPTLKFNFELQDSGGDNMLPIHALLLHQQTRQRYFSSWTWSGKIGELNNRYLYRKAYKFASLLIVAAYPRSYEQPLSTSRPTTTKSLDLLLSLATKAAEEMLVGPRLKVNLCILSMLGSVNLLRKMNFQSQTNSFRKKYRLYNNVRNQEIRHRLLNGLPKSNNHPLFSTAQHQ